MAQTAPAPDGLSSVPFSPLEDDIRQDLRSTSIQAFREVRGETERRAAPLSAEDQAVQSMPDASPIKWHRAHTTWFFEQFVLAPHVRAAAVGALTEAAVVSGLFLPFLIAGEFRMFDYRWQVNGDTVLGLFVAPGTPFTWSMRLAQGIAALGVGALLAWPLRRTLHAVWLAPLGVVAMRLLLDPVRYPWYWLALQVLALLGMAEFLTSGRVERVTRGVTNYSSWGSRGSAIR